MNTKLLSVPLTTAALALLLLAGACSQHQEAPAVPDRTALSPSRQALLRDIAPGTGADVGRSQTAVYGMGSAGGASTGSAGTASARRSNGFLGGNGGDANADRLPGLGSTDGVSRSTQAPLVPAALQVPADERDGPLQPVYFGFDSVVLAESALRTLRENGTWLTNHPQVRVRVEGHTDERGSSEYNLGLGQRRAERVRAGLLEAGVAPERVIVVSYGEEIPAQNGHDESAWRQNRRAQFTPLAVR